ncbi:hypothetical protein MMC30_001743 [Trapelia coarctata]|nr:hypothetical protein [Trapelia coarctata]
MPTATDSDLTDGDDGYISSDSDFYGDPPLLAHLHKTAHSYHPHPTHLPSKSLKSSLPNPTALALKNLAMASIPPRKPYNPHEGDASAYQLSDSLEDFLRRLPPSRTPSSMYGPWIWIANPQCPKRACPNHAHLMKVGEQMLKDFEGRKGKMEAEGAGKAQSTVSRKINPLRAALASDLLALAKECAETSGKWMLFPSASDVDRVWGIVAKGVLEGKLGVSAKVATSDDVGLEGGGERGKVICVYTADFGDKRDVKRVLEGMKGLGLLAGRGKWGGELGVWYKCDAFTHLGIDSSNPWGLKPSLYSSKEVLAWDMGIDRDGDVEMGDG